MSKNTLSAVRNRLSFEIQLTLAVALLATLVMVFLFAFNYQKQVRTNLEAAHVSGGTIVHLETEQLDAYLNDLGNFCVQLCFDSELYNQMQLSTPLTEREEQQVKNKIHNYYLQRSDLKRFGITFLRKNISLERSDASQHVLSLPVAESIRDSVAYQSCLTSSRNDAILPPISADGFFTYYHFLLRISGREPVALLTLEMDRTQLKKLLANHADDLLFLFNSAGTPLFASDPAMADSQTLSAVFNADDSQSILRVGHEDYLLSMADGTVSGIRMAVLHPKRLVTSQLRDAFVSSCLRGVLLWLGCLVVLMAFIHRLMGPLKRMSAKLHNVGKGNFEESMDTQGSREICELSDSFNYMTRHINRLIREKYLSEINAKNAQLVALEAQLNPHFLYNTLQAIATEALLVDQRQIYEMITALSTNLRYAIKGRDWVPLRDELRYTDNYILLQKVRLEDRLEVCRDTDSEALALLVPKLCMQTLVENAILHGLKNTTQHLTIHIEAAVKDDFLRLSVLDNGVGIQPERLLYLKRQFSAGEVSLSHEEVGLCNLYNRILLMCGNSASMSIESEEGQFTRVTMTLPAQREEEHEGAGD